MGLSIRFLDPPEKFENGRLGKPHGARLSAGSCGCWLDKLIPVGLVSLDKDFQWSW